MYLVVTYRNAKTLAKFFYVNKKESPTIPEPLDFPRQKIRARDGTRTRDPDLGKVFPDTLLTANTRIFQGFCGFASYILYQIARKYYTQL